MHPVQLAAQFPGLLGETGSGPGGPAGLDESVARIGQRLQEHPEVRPTPLPPAEKLRHRTGTGQGPVHLDIDVRAVLDATKDLSDDQVPEENRRVRLFPAVAAAREPGGNLPGGHETRCAGGQAVEQRGHRGGFVRDLRDIETGSFQFDARQGFRGAVSGGVEGQRHVVSLCFPRRVGHLQQGASQPGAGFSRRPEPVGEFYLAGNPAAGTPGEPPGISGQLPERPEQRVVVAVHGSARGDVEDVGGLAWVQANPVLLTPDVGVARQLVVDLDGSSRGKPQSREVQVDLGLHGVVRIQ